MSENPYQSPTPETDAAESSLAAGIRITGPPFRSASTLATITALFLVVGIVLSVLGIGLFAWAVKIMQGAQQGQSISQQAALQVNGLIELLGVGQIGLALLLIPTFLAWLYRSHQNLR